MTAAQMFRGVANVNFGTLAGKPIVAAFPTFDTFSPGGGSPRDESVLLTLQAASPPTARRLLAAPGGLAVWDENDVPGVFRAVNPPADPKTRGFPTFTGGLNASGKFMNIVTFRAGFTIIVAPPGTPGLDDLTKVEAAMRGAHRHARSLGFTAGIPTFNRIAGAAGGAELVVFKAAGPGVSLTSSARPAATDVAPPPWSFRSLPVLNEGGLAMVAGPATSGTPLIMNVFDGELSQFRPLPTPAVLAVDATGHAAQPIESQVSAVATDSTVHVVFSSTALFHARRLSGQAAFTVEIAGGRTAPEPTGVIGFFNSLALSPGGALHAFAYLSAPPGTPLSPPPGDDVGFNLAHLAFDGTSWTQDIVDGGGTPRGQVVGNAGQSSAAAFEPDGTLHVFYSLRVPATAGGTDPTSRLRHAVLGTDGWTAETLDGSGGTKPPGTPGTGPTRAEVGQSCTAVFFDGALWCVYEDRTWGNLRCAHGRRTAGGLVWDFHVVDGNARRGRTRGTVQSAVAVVWEDTLSLFYADMTAGVIRHAHRRAGATGWSYEVLDGLGGPDGRVAAPTTPLIAAAAGGRGTGAKPARPVFVAYHWTTTDAQVSSSLRLATLT